MRTWLSLAAVAPLLLWSAAPIFGQDVPADAAAPTEPALTLTYSDGRVEIARDTGISPAQPPDILDDGDRLTISDGRVEIAVGDGALVHVDRDADVRVEDGRLRLVRGRMVVRTALDSPLELLTPVGVARLEAQGEYELTARDLDGDTTLAAARGRATLALAGRDVPIAADDEVAVDPRGLDPRWARLGARRDAFTDWAARRVDDMDAARQGQPLPPELAVYAPAFATYGRWDTLPTYGPVWFPTAGPAWRPYANGSWRFTRFGWTWIDLDPWGWPVHHYGRWGRHPSRGWYWMPRRGWGPGWVSWALDAGYVGWAPLGWNSRPVVDFFVGARLGPLDLWASSWSVVPRGRFGGRGALGAHYTDLRTLPRPVLGGFVVQRQGPRGPAGWDRRWTPSRGYGRPSAVPRAPYGAGPQPDGRGPSGGAMPRARPRADTLDVAPPGDATTDPRRGGRDWSARMPSGDRRDVTSSPGEARPRADGVDRDRSRDAGRGDGPDDRGAYGRPGPAPGRAWGRPEAEPARPQAERGDGGGDRSSARSGDRGGERGNVRAPARGSERGGGAVSRGDGGRRGGDGGTARPATGGNGSGGGGGGRRRPR